MGLATAFLTHKEMQERDRIGIRHECRLWQLGFELVNRLDQTEKPLACAEERR